jgi:hypothetical protein
MTIERMLTFRVPDEESEALVAFSAETGRSQVDIFQEFLRTMEPRLRRMWRERANKAQVARRKGL